MDINYIGQNINGWIITKSYIKNCNGRNRTFLEGKCEICHKIKEIRADKRNQVVKCNCLNITKKSCEKKYNFENSLEKEWQKIELSDIYTKEELSNILKQNSDYKIYKINSKLPYSKDNIFLGSAKEFQEKRQELRIKREYKIKQELLAIKQKNGTDGVKCPYCGKTSPYINACPYCKMSYIANNSDSIYEPSNKKMIEYENETYATIPGHFLIVQRDKEIFYPLKDIVAKYAYQNDGISRIGLINVKEIDYCRQGVVGDFQAIDSDKKNFIIDNVFQYNKFAPFIFINYELVDRDKVYSINPGDVIHYAVLLKRKNTDNFTLAIYKGSIHVFSVENVVNIWGQGCGNIYFKKDNNLDYCINLITLGIVESCLSERITYLPGKMAFEYYSRKNEIEFYFNRGVFKNSVILYEIITSQYNVVPVKNEFIDDDTINYKVKIPLSDYNIHDIISIIINRKSDGLTHFGYSYNIYGYPLFRILRDSIKENKEKILELIEYESRDFFDYIIDNVNVSTTNTQNYKEIRDKLKEKYQCSDIELINLMINKYGIEQVFNLDFYYFKYREERTPKNFYNEMFDNFYKSLPESKRLWKSEYKLFLLVKNSYPDAIYQYCNPIFKGLIIDIYIPSLRIAIEYQGEQHYHVIERFSDNLLSERKENDNLKRKLCIDNNIQLIEWKYDELISKLNLDKKINELNMK